MSKPLPILVVEDSEEDFDMISTGLRKSGVERPVMRFTRSSEVRDWLEESGSAEFIIMDLNLPGESGIALIESLKNHPRHSCTPIAVLSTSSNPRDINESYEAGANAYHVKPLETPQFHSLVHRIAEYWARDVRTIAHTREALLP